MQGQARDIMTRDVATAAPSDDVWATAQRLVAHGYGGMPVLDDSGDLVGMVSGFDVLSKRGATIGEIMSRGVVFLDESASFDEVIELMGLHGIRRVPICRVGRAEPSDRVFDVLLLALSRALGFSPGSRLKRCSQRNGEQCDGQDTGTQHHPTL